MRPTDSRRPRSASARARQVAERWFQPRLESLEERCLLSISTVVGRHLFYDGSKYDGNTPGPNAADDAAIASDKSALLANSPQATFANISSYSKGINGVMVDITGSHPSITAADFLFRVGNNNTPAAWSTAPAPSTVTVVPNGGGAGVDRVKIYWADGAIAKKWFEVSLAANANTELAAADVFYFGNAVGDTGSGNVASSTLVNATDEIAARNNPALLISNIPLTNLYDFNRDGAVNATDQIIARNNATNAVTGTKLLLLSAPVLTAALANDTGPDGIPNSDGITTDATVSGSLTGVFPIVSFQAGLNLGPLSENVLPLVQPGGAFTISETLLTSMNGGTLPDGAYTLHLQAIDSNGSVTNRNVPFTLKHSVATPSVPDLIAADDTGASSVDNVTKINTPRFDVTAETGAIVRILVDNVVVAQGVASSTVQLMTSLLADGVRQVKAVAIDGAGNSAESTFLNVTIDTVAPTVAVASLVPFTDDVTPHLTIASAQGLGLARLDVDINDDGDFDDAGEFQRTSSALLDGATYFQLSPALPLDDGAGNAYVVRLRGRASDQAGNEGTSPLVGLEIDTVGSDALANYLAAAVSSYTVASTVDLGTYTFYAIDLTSQTWRSAADVNLPVWRHWLELVVPDGALSSSALLFVTGGNNTTGAPPAGAVPTAPDSSMLNIAQSTGAITARLRTVPSEPLTFTDEAFSRNEDAIIAYTFNKYMENLDEPDQTSNETWPLLLPMAQSAVAAMDAVQSLFPAIADFVVTGHSKRGWTTWLAAAGDDRVRGIIPGVIDVLNMDEQMMQHHAFYNGVTSFVNDGFSITLNDYVAFNIPQEVLTPEQRELGRIVDPYRYLHNGRFDDMPKLVLNASGDEFFIPTSSEYYFSDLPGTQNYLRYVPNSGHSISTTEVRTSTKTFFNAVINNLALPQYTWSVQQGGSLSVTTTTAPLSVTLWQATNPTNRDFRRGYNPTINWTSSALSPVGGSTYVANPSMPATGATAYFIEMRFTSPIAGEPYIFTTGVQVKSPIPLGTWPFYMPPAPLVAGGFAEPAAEADASGLDAVAAGLAVASHSEPPAAEAPPLPAAPVPAMPILVVDGEEDWGLAWSFDDDLLADLLADDDLADDEESHDEALAAWPVAN